MRLYVAHLAHSPPKWERAWRGASAPAIKSSANHRHPGDSTRLAFALGAALLAAGGSETARAYSLAPANTGFFANATSVALANQQATIKCDMSLKGQTNKKGVAKITSVFFSGADGACSGTTATGLPWTAKATGAGAGKVTGVAFGGAFLGPCGPGTVPMTVSGSGVWTLTGGALPPGCHINGSLPTSPPIKVVP